MQYLKLTLAILATAFLNSTSFAQNSWLDFGAALPKLNYPSTSSNVPNYGVQNFNQPPNTGTAYSSLNNGINTRLVPARDWKLGVSVQNTEVGAVVLQTSPGTAAQQVGIEPRDIIVAVSGTRIGQFDNRIVELAEEIRRSTDPSGRVSLLVQDSRTLQLRPLLVTLTSGTNALAGSIMIRDQSQLPYGSVLTVQLQNASKPYYEIAGGKSVTRSEGFGPFPFEINYNPQFIDPRDQYQITAYISVNNQVIYSLLQPIVVNSNALNQPYNITLERSNSAIAGQPNPNFPNTPSNVVNVGYPSGVDPNVLNQLFLQLLGRTPSPRELLAWQSYLQQGNSINDVKVKLLTSEQYRNRFPNESAYIQQLITTVFNRTPNQSEMNYWVGRYQATRSPEQVVTEMLTQVR